MADALRGEAGRLAALRGYGILDTPNEPQFDRIVRDATTIFRVPIAIVCLVDQHRQWFKARIGLTTQETPRAISFCTHAIRGDMVFEIADATQDPMFAANPLVTDEPGIRFYAGAPLRTDGGARIGTVCIIDTKPRPLLTAAEKEDLTSLARRTISCFEIRKAVGFDGAARAGRW